MWLFLIFMQHEPNTQSTWIIDEYGVTCPGAQSERHIINSDCEHVICSWDDEFILFQKCGDGEWKKAKFK